MQYIDYWNIQSLLYIIRGSASENVPLSWAKRENQTNSGLRKLLAQS